MAKKRKKNQKIIRYPRIIHINIGILIFIFIFIYMGLNVYTYLTKNRIQVYEVLQGTIVEDKEHTGIILREEELKYTEKAGYISYYIREGKKASIGTTIYAIDETGRMSEVLAANQEENNAISAEDLAELKKQISAFSISYSNEKFSEVYEAKYNFESAALEYAGLNNLENLEEILKSQGITFQQIRADRAGIVAYTTDGLEGLTADDISSESFNLENYKKEYLNSRTMVESGALAYRLVTDEQWSVVFELTAEEAASYQETTGVTVDFPDQNLSAAANFSMFSGSDGGYYGKLDLSRYMIQFISDRFVNFELVTDNFNGLKIPVSSIVTKDFQIVPIEYLSYGGDNNKPGFLKKVFNENGESSIVFVPTTLYYSTEEFYYIDSEELTSENVIVKPDSADEYHIGATASLQGVYNVNKGYAVFKQIDILTSNDEYCIVKKNMSYGLSDYDHIALDGSKVNENELLN